MRTAGAVVALALFSRLLRYRRRSRPLPSSGGDVTSLAEMTALALTAGLSLSQALEAASRRASGDLRREVHRILRRGQRLGLAPALMQGSGPAAGLYRIAARATITGAPLLPAVHAYVDELRGGERLRRIETLRKLPVKMLFPLALLILPGFLVLTVAPTLLGALDRLRL